MSSVSPGRAPDRGGQTVGKYRLLRTLGSGGMGTVYLAEHTSLGRRFALKFLHRELVASARSLARFAREAEIAARLEHENIAAVVDHDVDADGTPFLVMEYLDGCDLAELQRGIGVLPLARACRIVMQISRGLDAAHAMRVVHRDLKPTNIHVARRSDGTDHARILDFGVAKLVQAEEQFITADGVAIGTIHYMAPEQVRGERTVGPRSDLYSVGAILFELLTGARPHEATARHALMFRIVHEAPTPLSALRPDLPEGIIDVVARLLARDPEARFASAAAIAAVLHPFALLDDDAPAAAKAGRGPSDRTMTAPPSKTSTHDAIVVSPGRAWGGSWRLLIATAVGIAFVVAVLALRPGDPKGERDLTAATTALSVDPAGARAPPSAPSAPSAPSTPQTQSEGSERAGAPHRSPAPNPPESRRPLADLPPVSRTPPRRAAPPATPPSAAPPPPSHSLDLDRSNPY